MTYEKFSVILADAQDAWRRTQQRTPKDQAEYEAWEKEGRDAYMRVLFEGFVEAGWTPPGDAARVIPDVTDDDVTESHQLYYGSGISLVASMREVLLAHNARIAERMRTAKGGAS